MGKNSLSSFLPTHRYALALCPEFRVFSGLYFPVFGLNMEIYKVTKKPSEFGHLLCIVESMLLDSLTFSAECPLKGQTYLNKPAAESGRFVVYVFVTF